MDIRLLFALLIVLVVVAYYAGLRRFHGLARRMGGLARLDSLPGYYGMMVALWAGLPALLVLVVWQMFDDNLVRSMVMAGLPVDMQPANDAEYRLTLNVIQNIAAGLAEAPNPAYAAAAQHLDELRALSTRSMAATVLALMVGLGTLAWSRIGERLRARVHVERIVRGLLLASSMVAILTTLGILLSVLFESILFFTRVPAHEFLFGIEWSPQTALREDQVGSSGSFGAVPLFAGTLMISFIAMLVAVPVGLMSAIYLAEYASRRVREVIKPVLEILAGIPTVVYGYFAALTVGPWLSSLGDSLGLATASESALAAGLVMGIMIIPFVSSLSDDVINAVPQSMRDGSFALGATHSETIRQVVIPAALPGIVGGILLAVSRAIGETMIVVMAAGLSANLTANPLESVTTVTVQIVTLLVGDQEFDSAKTLAAFALGLILFIVTLALNIVALWVVKRFREQYE